MRILGFYPEKAQFGDGLTRGCGGPDGQTNLQPVRWCAQCKAVFEWPAGHSFTRRDCGVCAYRPGLPVAYEAIAKLMGRLCGYKPLRVESQTIIGITWAEYMAEFESSGVVTPEQFLSGDLKPLREFWQHVANQIKAGAAA